MSITLTAGSVRVSLEVTYDDRASANAATTIMSTELATAGAASLFFQA